MILLPRAAVLKKDEPIPGHPMHGDWRIKEWPVSFVDIHGAVHHAQNAKVPVLIPIVEVAFKPGDYYGGDDFSTESERYRKADVRFPLLVAKMENPGARPYRLIDGRRRYDKLVRAGEALALAYVFEREEIMPFVWPVLRSGGGSGDD
jgi:hypothetical protein